MNRGHKAYQFLQRAAVVGALLLAGGCSSWPLPPKLTYGQRDIVQNFYIGGTAGVYRVLAENDTTPDPQLEMTIRQLRATRMFDQVEHLTNLKDPPAFKIELQKVHTCGGSFPPVWLVMSLGMLPATESVCSGQNLRMYRLNGKNYVELDSRYEGTVVHGWLANLFEVSADRVQGFTPPEPTDHQRFIDYLAWTIASRKPDVLKLRQARDQRVLSVPQASRGSQGTEGNRTRIVKADKARKRSE